MTLRHDTLPADVGAAFRLTDSLPPAYLTTVLGERVRHGLSGEPKSLPSSLFYDALGDQLFLQICDLHEYYPTRVEREILDRRAQRIAQLTGAATLVEIGAGACEKTCVLLEELWGVGTLRHYVPLDVSRSVLLEAGRTLNRDYPGLPVSAVLGDFEADFALPAVPGPRLVAFLGGTLGNLDPGGRAAFYARVRQVPADALLLGVDLVKDPAVLVPAYDDAAGVTAQFNRNALRALNDRFAADFDPAAFDHLATWNQELERIEMWLRSRIEQRVEIPRLALRAHFERGEAVRTEISCKFRRESLTAELAAAGFTVTQWWTDRAEYYALLLAIPADV